jgi:glucosamine--fructose-6-phosphate aminotransferase (isomerizing)
VNGELMAAEMAEQPDVLARIAERFDSFAEQVRAVAPERLAGVVFVARGSSDHAAVYGRYLVEMASGRPAGLAAPSIHTAYRADVDYSGYLAVAVSQSGATPEIVTVCERIREAGARTVAIVNDEDSALAEAVEAVLPVGAAPERAVPATKTVTGQLLAVAAVAAALGPVPFGGEQLRNLPGQVSAVLDDPSPARALAGRWSGAERLFVVSRGLMFAAALETALKIKETASVLAEGISSADFRHGPIAAADPDVPVLVLDGGGPVSPDLRDLVQVLTDRGGPLAVCSAAGGADLPLPAADAPEALAVIPAVVRAQQLAHALAKARGFDPDAPAGLAKVTETH